MTADPATLRALIARLEAGENERDIDASLELLIAPGEIVWVMANYTMETNPVVKRPSTNHISGFSKEPVRYYTTSVDAAIAFTKAVLPGCAWGVMWNGASVWTAPVGVFGVPGEPAPALVIATLKAKLAEVEAPNA